MSTPPLPDVLASLITEFAVPSLRLRSNELIIKVDKHTITVPAKVGLWYVQWGPYAYMPPTEKYIGSVRVLLLHHESVDMKSLPSAVNMKYNDSDGKDSWPVEMDENSRGKTLNAKTILLCSRNGPLLNITPQYNENEPPVIRLLSTVAIADGIIGLMFRRYNEDIETKAFDMVARKFKPKAEAILKELGLKPGYGQYSAQAVTISSPDNLLKLFTPQELEESGLPLSVTYVRFIYSQLADGTSGWWVRDNNHKEYEFPHGFALPHTRQLALVMNGDPRLTMTLDPEFNADYFRTLHELERRNPYQF